MNPTLTPEQERILRESTSVAQRAAQSIGGTFTQGVGFTPGTGPGAYQPPTAITPDSLTPAEPYKLPQPKQAQSSEALVPSVNSTAAAANTLVNTTETSPTADVAKSDNQSFLKKLFEKYTGQNAEIANINKETDVAAKKARAQELANNLDVIDKEFRDQVAIIKTSPGGTVSGNAEKLALAQDVYNNRRANAALSYRIASNDYTNAAELADSKIKAVREDLTQGINLYKLAVDAVNNDLTESEKLKVASNLRIKEDAAKRVLDTYDTALQAGFDNKAGSGYFDALDEARRSGNPAEINRVMSRYGYKTLDQQLKAAQIADIYSKVGERNPKGTGELQLAQAEDAINTTTNLLNDSYLTTAVGPNAAARISLSSGFTGGKQNFVAGIEQLRSNLNLQSLIDAKARGATFGALSDQELKVLSNSATRIGSWAVKDKDGNVTEYNVSEKEFKKELDKINNFAKLDYILKGGSPDSVNVKIINGKELWTENSDGTFTRLR